MADEADFDCVDSHFHIWELQRFDYMWPTPQETALYRDFRVDDLRTAVKDTPVKHCVFVQVLNNSVDEAVWVSQLADQHPIIKGVVAGLDVTDREFASKLDRLTSQSNKIVAIRHILDFEDENWLTRDDVIAGLRQLESRDIPFELLLRPNLLKHAVPLSDHLPRLRMVVDHLAKPYIKKRLMDDWVQDMARLARNPNIHCKLSGMVTEADWDCWKPDDLQPYVKHILECFGPERCMYGSDWPVCTLAHASYNDVFNTMRRLVRNVSPDHERAIFRDNAIGFYKLKI